MPSAPAAQDFPQTSTFVELQKTYWQDVDEAHFRWQTEGAFNRVALHYRLGAPSLGKNRGVAAALRGMERAAGLLPRSTWAYFTVRAVAP